MKYPIAIDIQEYRLATEEEKQKLFQAIKDNGYEWNAETNTLEKVIELKFKVGDKIRHKRTGKTFIITHADKLSYYVNSNHFAIWIEEQDNYELVPDKFDILLKDLCARLPYGVKCVSGVDDAILIIEGINPNCNGASEVQVTYERSGINFDTKISSIKPYLFPLSSMTEEQYEKFIIISGWDGDIEDIRRGKFSCVGYIGLDYIYDTIDWFLKNHFDIYGLIPMGLANDATNLNIY